MEKTWVLRCPLRWCSYCKTNSSNELSGILWFVCTSFFRVFQCHFFRSTVEVDERFLLVDAAFASFNHFVLFFVPWEVRLAGGFARGSCFVCRGAFSFRCSCWFRRASSTTCWWLNWSRLTIGLFLLLSVGGWSLFQKVWHVLLLPSLCWFFLLNRTFFYFFLITLIFAYSIACNDVY